MNADEIIMTIIDIEKIRNVARMAQNPVFKAIWTEKADKLEERLAGQPWLRTYDGRLQ